MRDTHIGDNAELYALGSLSDVERAQVEAHVANCEECLRRLGAAEETVLGLEQETPVQPLPAGARAPVFRSRRPLTRWWVGVAAAAALIVGYLLPHPVSQPTRGVAQVAMLHSHFNHSQFAGSGPLAKVLYARDRSWYYIVVEGAHSYSVEGVNPAGTTALGTTVSGDGTSELFVPHAQRFERIDLRENSKVVESAQIR